MFLQTVTKTNFFEAVHIEDYGNTPIITSLLEILKSKKINYFKKSALKEELNFNQGNSISDHTKTIT